jgi:hypothetical protein
MNKEKCNHILGYYFAHMDEHEGLLFKHTEKELDKIKPRKLQKIYFDFCSSCGENLKEE